MHHLRLVGSYARWLLLVSAALTGFVIGVVTLVVGTWRTEHLCLFAASCVVIMSGITLAYHRYLTHRAYEFTKLGACIVKPILMLAGCLSWQGPPLWWAAVHTDHHRHADQKEDPHTPQTQSAGFWRRLGQLLWAHVFWIPHAQPSIRQFCAWRRPGMVERLFSHPAVYLLAGPLGGLLIAYLIGGPLGIAWYLAAVFVTLNLTWSVNSLTHLIGYRSFQTPDASTNLWALAWLTGGESLHNNHHAFQKSARFGHRWWERAADLGWWQIWLLWHLGMVRNVHVPTAEQLGNRLRRGKHARSPRPAIQETVGHA